MGREKEEEWMRRRGGRTRRVENGSQRRERSRPEGEVEQKLISREISYVLTRKLSYIEVR